MREDDLLVLLERSVAQLPQSGLRHAIKRLIAATRQDAVDVTVRRLDVAIVLAAVARQAVPMKPALHPEQR